MRFEGSFSAKAPQDRVFAFFLDPNELSSCIDDPHTIEVEDEDHFRGSVRSGVGFVKGTFQLTAAVADRDPPKRARIQVQGSGMGSGFDIDATLDLSESGGTTTVRWAADVLMNGTIASLGARLLQGTIDKKSKAFFENVRQKLEPA